MTRRGARHAIESKAPAGRILLVGDAGGSLYYNGDFDKD
jgi:hypothetical protein